MSFADDSDLRVLEKLGEGFAQYVDQAAHGLRDAVHARVVELAHAKLHSRLRPFLDVLTDRQTGQAYEVVLGGSADWIEKGMEPHDLHDALLRSPKARVSKDGKRYVVVPFEHSRAGPSPRPAAANSLGDALRAALKRERVSATKITKMADGKPVLGLVRRLHVTDGPLAASGRPILQGLGIYQRPAGEKVSRSAMTFRVISEGSPGWRHPGIKPANIMKEAGEWAAEQWEKIVDDELAARLTQG